MSDKEEIKQEETGEVEGYFKCDCGKFVKNTKASI
jgi:hypothetical protein